MEITQDIKNNKKLVSVIIPNYNHSFFLKQRIESVLNQTYPAIEVIILDDASTDNSKIVIEGFREHPKVVAILYNEKNSGSTFQQWQKGIALAKGNYIWIAESDDAAEFTFLEDLLTDISWKGDTVMAFCDSVIIENDIAIDNSRNWSSVYKEGILKDSGCYQGSLFCEKYLINHCIISNVSSVVFETTALKSYRFSNELTFCEDWLMYLTLLQQKSFIYINKPLNYFRKHSQTVRVQKLHLLHDESIKVIQKAVGIFKSNGLSVKQLKVAFAEWVFKDAWWTSKYRLTFSNIITYWKQLQLVNVVTFFNIIHRAIRA